MSRNNSKQFSKRFIVKSIIELIKGEEINMDFEFLNFRATNVKSQCLMILIKTTE